MQLKYVNTKEEIIALNKKSKQIEPHLHNALEIVCVTSGTLELGVGQELYHMEKDLGVSKYVLSRLFSKTFHRNFNQYLNDARLSYACYRLENTRDSITNICMDSGFESQRTFNRVVKERYKISPSGYRNAYVRDMLFWHYDTE